MSISFRLARLSSPLCSSTKCECGFKKVLFGGFGVWIGVLSDLFSVIAGKEITIATWLSLRLVMTGRRLLISQ